MNDTSDNMISIVLGMPQHGWLPVDFHFKDFHLDFAASHILNDPIEELFHAVTKLQNNEVRRVTWWLEPGAYFFDFVKNNQNFTLTIIETSDLHNATAGNTELISISGNENDILVPFRIAVKQFSAENYAKNHWPHKLGKNKIAML